MRELASIFAVEVAAYVGLDNHMHVALKLNDATASSQRLASLFGKVGSGGPTEHRSTAAILSV